MPSEFQFVTLVPTRAFDFDSPAYFLNFQRSSERPSAIFSKFFTDLYLQILLKWEIMIAPRRWFIVNRDSESLLSCLGGGHRSEGGEL